eukprot:g4662.t1
MYFENRNKDPDAPFVFWTNGGPGCSSFFGLFLENGPYEIQEDLSLCWKEYGWDVGHNIVFVEQPIGVGYSYSSSSDDKVTTEEQVGDDMVQFFYAFLKAHPELAKKDLFISGESFGGHYLPAIAKSIMQANAEKKGIHLNLKGVIMGNPWTHPTSHYLSYPDFALQNGLINKATRDMMMGSWARCDTALASCDARTWILQQFICNGAYAFCQSRLFSPVLVVHPSLNYYDIRRFDCFVSGCYDISLLTKFLNTPAIQKKIGAKTSIKWEDCRRSIRMDLGWDVAHDMRPVVQEILKNGMKVFVFAGDKDFICNYLGNEYWIDDMKWKSAKKWASTEKMEWISGGKVAGYFKHYKHLMFLRVYDAGHMVPMDQPEVALDMLTTYTRGKKFKTKPQVTTKSSVYATT